MPCGVVTQHGQIVASVIENKKNAPTTPTKQNGHSYKTKQESRFHFRAVIGLSFYKRKPLPSSHSAPDGAACPALPELALPRCLHRLEFSRAQLLDSNPLCRGL